MGFEHFRVKVFKINIFCETPKLLHAQNLLRNAFRTHLLKKPDEKDELSAFEKVCRLFS